MSRSDLIEIIYEVRKNEPALTKENEELKAQLADRRLKAEKAGSLAELSALVNGFFESAQATADQYIESVKAWAQEAGQKEKAEYDASEGE